MRYCKFLSFIILVFLMFHFSQAGKVITLQTGWKFAKGQNDLAWQPGFNDSKWQDVTIPHDWAITGPVLIHGDGSTGKLPWQGEGWYRKKMMIPAAYKGKEIYLLCDGIMAFPEIFVNGKLAGKWDYGYNSFYIDITGFLKPGQENVIAIHADTREHESRWYPGAGIYRKVQMIVENPVHIGIWGTHITTPEINQDQAKVRIINTLRNSSAATVASIRVENIVYSPSGKEVARNTADCSLRSGESREVEMTLQIMNPVLWDVDHPELYKIKTLLYRVNVMSDSTITPFGIRTIQVTADNGLLLNGKRVQLQGVNLHHDQGLLGTAFHVRAAERQLEIMKAMGCNALRTSHNAAAPEMLDLCDRMGILVFDELFDKWDKKADITDTTRFDSFAERNVRNFVLRDRNHPSVFIWSVGNEMGDIQNNLDNGFSKLQTMVALFRKYDDTRPVTMVCDNLKSAALRHFDYYDVHSWNYGRRYSLARQMAPDKGVIISESASTVSTRGFYEFPLPVKKTDFSNSLQVSSYDLNAPAWAELPDDDFMWQQQEPYVAGEFVWTGFDYLGEPTPYDNFWTKAHGLSDSLASRISYFGIVDLCGIPKDRYFLYKSHWKPEENIVHILPHWNWRQRLNDTVPVFVYTNGDCAELFLNGRSLGKKCKDPSSLNSVERFRLMWKNVVYEPGTLKAVAYHDGRVIGASTLKTAGEPFAIKLTPDRKVLRPDGQDLSYILIEAVDKDGDPCPLADNRIDISVTGPAKIAGIGNGNPQSADPFQANHVRLFYGKAMLILGSGFNAGSTMVTATSKGLAKATVVIAVK